MNTRTLAVLAVLSLLTASLALSGGPVRAQEPPPQSSPQPLLPQGAAGSPAAVSGYVNADGSFTYQGRLQYNDVEYDGACDFSVGVYDAESGGTMIAGPYERLGIQVTKGFFSFALGYQPWGPQLWLGISVRCPSLIGPYHPLNPRQKITAAPYADSLRPGSRTSALDAAGNILTTAYVSSPDHGAVAGYSNFTGTAGLRGENTALSGTAGVLGASRQSGLVRGNTGVLGLASLGTADMVPDGLYDAGGTFVGPMGVVGAASTETEYGYGMAGFAGGTRGVGVYAMATAPTGPNYGVLASSNSFSGTGISGAAPLTGVVGIATSTQFPAVGVHGEVSTTGSIGAAGVYGIQNGGSGYSSAGGWKAGVWGDSATQIGVLGTSPNLGVEGLSTEGVGVAGFSFFGAGVYGSSLHDYGGYFTSLYNSTAAYFGGNVVVTGTISAGGGKAFQIDHPLDPENQYLYHYSVESPRLQNMYNGSATLDARGEAVITLPDYFAAVNAGEYTYDLTPIGAPMPDLYVAAEVQGNSFKVAGGVAGKKVSWVLYAQRNDAWVRDHPQTDVVAKPAEEVGTYQYPQGYGKPVSAAVPGPLSGKDLPGPIPPIPGRQ